MTPFRGSYKPKWPSLWGYVTPFRGEAPHKTPLWGCESMTLSLSLGTCDPTEGLQRGRKIGDDHQDEHHTY